MDTQIHNTLVQAVITYLELNVFTVPFRTNMTSGRKLPQRTLINLGWDDAIKINQTKFRLG